MTEIFEFVCPICQKKISSLVKSQAEFNYQVHLASCKIKQKVNK